MKVEACATDSKLPRRPAQTSSERHIRKMLGMQEDEQVHERIVAKGFEHTRSGTRTSTY